MDENKDDGIYLSGLLAHLKPLIQYLISKWLLFVAAGVIGVILGFGYFFIQKPKYEATCTFILEEKQSSMGGLSGLASQFGFDLGSMGGGAGGLFSGDNILEILKSKKIVTKVLLAKIDSSQPRSKSMADEYLEFSKMKKKWKKSPPLPNVLFDSVGSELTQLQDTVLNLIYDRIIKKSLIVDRVSKKGNLISVQVTSPDRAFAVQMSQRIVEEAKALYIFIRVGNAQTNINNLQAKADSLQALLNGRTYVAASSQVVDANPGLAATRVPAEIAMRDKTVAATLYSEVIKNLEASKMMLAQQTPVIQVIDYPSMTAEDNLQSKLKLMVVGAILALVVSFFWVFFRYVIKVNS